MALVKGINCGFVTVAPTADPAGTNSTADSFAWGMKDTAPAGNNIVTEIGWYCDNATEAADFEVGIHTHDAGNDRPDTLVVAAESAAKGTSSGWKKISGLSIPITAGTIYWITFQLDNTETTSLWNRSNSGGEKIDYKTSQSSMPSPWGVSSGTFEALGSIYALIVKSSIGGFSGGQPWIFLKDMWEKHNKIWTPKGILIPERI